MKKKKVKQNNPETSLDKHRKVFESEEHWNLRKSFIAVHSDKFSEDELLCLAQVFVNVEFLGCRYPQETMQQVAQLAQEVPEIKNYRATRQNKLKRTFVGAQDASQAKFTKTTAKRKLENESTSSKKKCLESIEKSSHQQPMIKFNKSQQLDNLQRLLKDVVFLETPDGDSNGSLNKTVADMQRLGRLEMKFDAEEKKYFYIFDGQIVGEGFGENKKKAKKIADENLVETLKANCYTIKKKVWFLSHESVVQKDGSIAKQESKEEDSSLDSNQLQENNKGFKMLKMLGWKGGSLGTKGEGIIDPIKCEIKIGRKGLGAGSLDDSNKFDFKFFKSLLRNFKQSNVEYDLVFSNEFTKEERAQIHQIALTLQLTTKSYGKDESRHIVISSAKITNQELLFKLLDGDQHLLEKYEIIKPGKEL